MAERNGERFCHAWRRLNRGFSQAVSTLKWLRCRSVYCCFGNGPTGTTFTLIRARPTIWRNGYWRITSLRPRDDRKPGGKALGNRRARAPLRRGDPSAPCARPALCSPYSPGRCAFSSWQRRVRRRGADHHGLSARSPDWRARLRTQRASIVGLGKVRQASIAGAMPRPPPDPHKHRPQGSPPGSSARRCCALSSAGVAPV
jgi:hypothetical protein